MSLRLTTTQWKGTFFSPILYVRRLVLEKLSNLKEMKLLTEDPGCNKMPPVWWGVAKAPPFKKKLTPPLFPTCP